MPLDETVAGTPERHPARRVVVCVAALVLVVRALYLDGPLLPDEAGYLLVARDWHGGGPQLYGHYFVDRPPLLLLVYRLASMVGWDAFVRVLAGLFAVLLVVSAAWAARVAAGERAMAWAALVAGALVVSPLLAVQSADGEMFAAPVVMTSVALTLTAVERRSAPMALAAGLAAGAAVMLKQNFVDGFVFAAVLLVAVGWQRRLPRRDLLRLAGAGVAGGLVVLAAAVAFAVWSRVGTGVAWAAIFGLRTSALDVIEDHGLHATVVRAIFLVVAAVASGAVPMLAVLALDGRRARPQGPPVGWAVAATLLTQLGSIAMGGSYWLHYLIQLVPMLALAAGVWAPTSRRVRSMAVFAALSAMTATGVVLQSGAAFPRSPGTVGEWVHESAARGDTATVLYGNADVQEATGLPSPYEQLWTLPMRTLDPRLASLRSVLTGDEAPTWVVAWIPLDAWHIDDEGRVRRALEEHYRRVATVCGRPVYLHDGEQRRLARVPDGHCAGGPRR